MRTQSCACAGIHTCTNTHTHTHTHVCARLSRQGVIRCSQPFLGSHSRGFLAHQQMAPPVQDWFKRTQDAFPHVRISNRKQFCREFWWDLAKRVINEPKSAQDFFFTELQGAEQSTYRQTNGVLYRLQERGFVDVTVGTTMFDTFTVLQILDPGSVPLSQDVSSPFKFGYDYYAQCAKRQDSKGCMKNILVHTQELEIEFRKHLPDLKNVFVHECDKEHEQLRSTAK